MTATLDPSPPTPGQEASPPGPPRWVLAAFALGGLAFLAIALATLVLGDDESSRPAASRWHGTLLDPGPPRPEFVLTDTEGRRFDFAAETGGRLTLLFYGYTHCPDICPVHLATLAQALDRVDVDVRVVFVTTDPARDTPERIRSWLDTFDPSFIGLTGTPEEVAAAQRAMGTAVAVAEAPDADGDYTVGHASGVWVITPDDRAHLVYGFGTRQDDWVADLPAIATEPDWQVPSP
jgi:protein SCO1/2